ncbi:hypothetical protein M5K25_024503 [Dendrobium thyrsiflorum]|uniref:Uncharacterized protein n=1 Tax=Dendrobium thyrsiflorum TaxID=117978 RepID=A0ABD0U2B6_DENTH
MKRKKFNPRVSGFEIPYCRNPSRVAPTKEISLISDVDIHGVELYRRISYPSPLSITSKAGHSMRLHVGGKTPTEDDGKEKPGLEKLRTKMKENR